jgi:hypothetical protein
MVSSEDMAAGLVACVERILNGEDDYLEGPGLW